MSDVAKRAILVTGGAGYIGSHTVLALLAGDYPVVVLDNLSTGCRDDVAKDAVFVEGDVADDPLVSRLLREYGIAAVIHFAGSIRVEESVSDPLKYYRNNTCASLTLIETCVRERIGRFIFSSTAAAYGNAEILPINETTPLRPINPYGWSKVMTEQILRDVAVLGNLTVGVLRYFNVAGADGEGRAGQRSENATHLIKVASEVATGKRPGMKIFGTDYPTPDGTCIRDYIHVTDLADAHVRVLQWLDGQRGFEVMNCGYGHGYSVRDVLTTVEQVCGKPLQVELADRRAGDCAALVADNTRLLRNTGWTPRHNDLATIVRTALEWEAKIGA